MSAVERLCNRCILIKKGEIRENSTDVSAAIKTYLKTNGDETQGYLWSSTERTYDNDWYRPGEMYLADQDGNLLNSSIRNDMPAWLVIKGEIKTPDPSITIGYALYTEDGILLYWTFQTDQNEPSWPSLGKGPFMLKTQIPPRLLNEGAYRLEIIGGLNDRRWLFAPGGDNPTIHFSIKGGLSNSPYWTVRRAGVLAPVLPWQKEEAD